MQQNDIVFINVVGTNAATRVSKAILKRFNGNGQLLDDAGAVVTGSTETLTNLPSQASAKATVPQFPIAEIAAAQAANDVEKIKEIQLAYGKQVAAFEAQQGGISPNAQVAQSVMSYLATYHGFKETDGDHFVLKTSDIDVIVTQMADRSIYTVSAQAVFGLLA